MTLIDFRNVSQLFYGNNEIQSVYYMGEKIWEKISGMNFRRILYQINFNFTNFYVDTFGAKIETLNSKKWIYAQQPNLNIRLNRLQGNYLISRGGLKFKAYSTEAKTIRGYVNGGRGTTVDFSFNITTKEQVFSIALENLMTESNGSLQLYFYGFTYLKSFYFTDFEVGEV